MASLLSTAMMLYTMHSDILHLINNQHFTLYDYLPTSVQELLTEITLHDYLTGDTGTSYSEFSYLLLYFLPDITAEQRLTMVHNLPQRYRETVFSLGGDGASYPIQ